MCNRRLRSHPRSPLLQNLFLPFCDFDPTCTSRSTVIAHRGSESPSVFSSISTRFRKPSVHYVCTTRVLEKTSLEAPELQEPGGRIPLATESCRKMPGTSGDHAVDSDTTRRPPRDHRETTRRPREHCQNAYRRMEHGVRNGFPKYWRDSSKSAPESPRTLVTSGSRTSTKVLFPKHWRMLLGCMPSALARPLSDQQTSRSHLACPSVRACVLAHSGHRRLMLAHLACEIQSNTRMRFPQVLLRLKVLASSKEWSVPYCYLQ